MKTLADYVSTKYLNAPLFRVHAYRDGVEVYRSELQPELRAKQISYYFKECTDKIDLVETRLVSGEFAVVSGE